MIKLSKGVIPEILRINALNWLTELKTALVGGDKAEIARRRSRYNHTDIKQAVIKETNGKCAYCETDFRAAAHGDIEHLVPKSLDENLSFEWSNLGFSCQICNQHKGSKDPLLHEIIDPYVTDPEPYIIFCGHIVNSNGTPQGVKTIHHLGLQRAELLERRLKVYLNLITLLDRIKMAPDPSVKQILKADFERNELGPETEFSAMRRDFWRCFQSTIRI